MRVTESICNKLYKVGIQGKKKHRGPSMTELEFKEFMNMINVLNTIKRDETMICGFNIDRFKFPKKLEELILPVEISYSGDQHGNNFMSEKYSSYNPAAAGFVDVTEFTKLLQEAGHNIGAKGKTYAEIIKQGTPDFKEIKIGEKEEFRLWLTPQEFYSLGEQFLANFKADTSDDKFDTVDSYKTYGNLNDYADRFTTSDSKVRRTTSDYVPVMATVDLYNTKQYAYDFEDMVEDWFVALCDIIVKEK